MRPPFANAWVYCLPLVSVWVAASGFASVIAVVIFWAGVQASVAVDFLGGSRWHGLPFF